MILCVFLCIKQFNTYTHDTAVVLQRELDRIAEVLREQAKNKSQFFS